MLTMGANRRTTGATGVADERTLIDASTGEYWLLANKGRRKYCFPGGFAFVGLVYITRLLDARVPADGYRLALLLMREAGYAGICSRPFGELAQLLGVHRSRISRLLTALEKEAVCQRIGGSAVLVNPTFCFRGSPKEQHKALEMWAQHRPFAIVKQERKSA